MRPIVWLGNECLYFLLLLLPQNNDQIQGHSFNSSDAKWNFNGLICHHFFISLPQNQAKCWTLGIRFGHTICVKDVHKISYEVKCVEKTQKPVYMYILFHNKIVQGLSKYSCIN